ncbi:MAG: hypothetical protein ABI586_09415, partial [Candidatus Nanopelagicales bacterium]
RDRQPVCVCGPGNSRGRSGWDASMRMFVLVLVPKTTAQCVPLGSPCGSPIAVDCTNAHKLAEWWKAVLDYVDALRLAVKGREATVPLSHLDHRDPPPRPRCLVLAQSMSAAG